MTKNVLMSLLALIVLVSYSPARIIEVSMVDSRFSPDTAFAATGDTVRWTNNGAMSHTSTSGKPDSAPGALWDSPFLPNGGTYLLPVTFTAGDIPYYCRLHSLTMKGLLRVASGVEEEPGRAAGALCFTMASLNPAAVSFQLPSRQPVTLRVYDAVGREAALLLDRVALDRGAYRVALARFGLDEGFYIVTLSGSSGSTAARMTVVR